LWEAGGELNERKLALSKQNPREKPRDSGTSRDENKGVVEGGTHRRGDGESGNPDVSKQGESQVGRTNKNEMEISR